MLKGSQQHFKILVETVLAVASLFCFVLRQYCYKDRQSAV